MFLISLHYLRCHQKRPNVFLFFKMYPTTINFHYLEKSCTHYLMSKSLFSITYFSMVFAELQSSNLIEYPTSCPSMTSISSATLWATLMAATLRGCVQATPRFGPGRDLTMSTHHWGIWKRGRDQIISILYWVSQFFKQMNEYIWSQSLIPSWQGCEKG